MAKRLFCFGIFFMTFGLLAAQPWMLGVKQPTKTPSFADTLGEFYLKDSLAIAQLLQSIDTSQTQVSNRCPLHYLIYFQGNTKQKMQTLALRLSCNSIEWNGKTYPFSSQNLHFLMDVAKTPDLRVLDFPNIQSARKAYAEMIKDPQLLYISEPDWWQYEGQATYIFLCENTPFHCTEMRQKIRQFLLEKLYAKFPDERVNIQITGGNAEQVQFEIHCSAELGQELPYLLSDSKLKWQPYSRFYLKAWWEK